MRVEVYRSAAGVLWWREEERIWHLQPSAGHEATAAEAEEFVATAERFLGGARAPLLLDRSHSYSPSFAALQTIAAPAPRFISAIAYYAPTAEARAASRTVMETFVKRMMPDVEIFDNEAEAVRWLVSRVGTT